MPMNPATDKESLKRLLKEVLAETLDERRDLLHEVFAEVREDFALASTIREGQKSELTTRAEVFNLFEADEATQYLSGATSVKR